MAVDQQGREYIELQQVLKLARIVETGGEAKYLIQGGAVRLNGEVETRRRKKVYPGDVVEVEGEEFHVALGDEDEEGSL